MKVLVVGSGGREHALCWKISKSKKVKKVYCAPGNAGTALAVENVDIKAEDIKGLLDFALKNKIDLTVVGPEVPLVKGIVDEFQKAGLKIFGPTAKAAQLEGSKIFSKELMLKYDIPTAAAGVFDNFSAAFQHVEAMGTPVVVKADGLAAGKGVIICKTKSEAKHAIECIMIKKEFGPAGDKVVVEECLEGQEASILAFTDGETIISMASAQDHKRVNDNDEGPNTGGMGAYSPAPIVTDAVMEEIYQKVLVPAVKGMKAEGIPYQGVLYAGVMLTKKGPMVLEFNARFGDPETQPILMRMRSDIVPIFEAVIDGKLDKVKIEWHDKPAVCVVMASGGYPGHYKKGIPITGLEKAAKLPDVYVFHAGTKKEGDKIVTSGGRALGVTALGYSIKNAIENAYNAVEMIEFEGMHYRRDIGKRALRK